jgi:DNA-binding response OmpR family regulator
MGLLHFLTRLFSRWRRRDETTERVSKRVLVVDDDKFLNKIVRELLMRNGIETDCAFDGEEALKKVGSFRPHAVILDVMMPKENGYRVSRFIKSLAKIGPRGGSPKVLLLTSRRLDEEPEREEAFRQFSMADAVMYKPFEFTDLLSQLDSLLRDPRIESEPRT